MTRKKASTLSEGFFDLEVSLTVLESCCKAEPGQLMHLSGKATKQGKRQVKNVNIQIQRKNESVSLKISDTSSQWLTEKLTFIISEPESDLKENSNHSNVDSSISSSDNLSEVHNGTDNSTVQSDQRKHVDNKTTEDDCDGQNRADVCQSFAGTMSEEHCDSSFSNHDEDTQGSDTKQDTDPGQEQNGTLQQDNVQCRFCGKSFPTNPSRPLMALQQHETKFCKRNPWSVTTLEPKPTVSEKYPHCCQYCPHAFTTEAKCKKHEANCARRPDYMAKFDMKALRICDICNHMCANELGLAYHRTKTHGCPSSAKPRRHRKATPCACRFCGKMVSSHSTRFHHEHFKCEKNPNVEQGVRCKFCAQMCTKDKLPLHIAKHHSQKEQHMCEVCGKVFNGKHKLYQHRLTHTEIQTPKHKCPHCDKAYLLKTRLKIHMSKHIEERTVQCTVCGKFFKNKHQENRHRITVHENRYRFHCEKCGHGMAKKAYLDNHKCGRVRRAQDTNQKVDDKIEKTNFDMVMVCPVAETEPTPETVNPVPAYNYYQEQSPFIPQRYEQQGQVISQDGILLEYFTS